MKQKKDATITARITKKLNAELERASKEKGITKNEFIERAIIHELSNNHKDNDKIVLEELLVLQDVIQERINIRKESQTETETTTYNTMYYIRLAEQKMQERGAVTETYVKSLADKAGLTFLEFTQASLDAGIVLVIV